MERIRRRYYIIGTLIIVLLQIGIYFMTVYNTENGYSLYQESEGDSFFFISLFIVLTIVELILARGRFQDINRSGFLALLLLIPVVNIVVMIPLVFTDGSIGRNRYGEDPKFRKHPAPKHWANFSSKNTSNQSSDDNP